MAINLTRRDFLLYGGAAVAGVTLGELGRRALAGADERAATWHGGAPERWATSVCRACPAACGLRVRLINDVPVKLEGNPLCPVSRGRLCAKGQASLESYFDPDRLTGPARRTGTGRNSEWKRIEWGAAITLLASRLQPAASPGRILAVAAEERGPLADAWTHFWKTAGARLLWTPAAAAPRLHEAFGALTGVDADPLFDREHATYVLSFGAPIAEDWLSPVWTLRSYGRLRRGSPHERGRLVQIDARRSMTARKADEWLAVPADRQAALAYGLAAVLLREGRTARDAFGAASGNIPDFERAVVARYMADEVAAMTGVPVVTVLRLARDLVASPRPLVTVATDADPALIEAVMSLNALIGALDRPGGMFAAVRPRATSEPDQRLASPQDLASARVVALRDASVLRSLSTPTALLETVERAEFVVSFSPYLDEAAQAADLLMPLHTPLENWHAAVPPAAIRGEQIAVSRPAAAARLDTRDGGALLKMMATAAGGDLAAACSWNTSEDLVSAEVTRLGHERRGTPYATPYQTEWVGQLEHGGWWIQAENSPESFATAVLDSGGWLDPAFEPGEILTTLEARGGPSLSLPVTRAARKDEGDPSTRGEYPLRATAFTPAVIDLVGGQNQPALFELLGQPDGLPWRVWVEMSPDTARALNIQHGALVRVSSPHGTIEAVAVLAEGAAPDCVAIAHVPFMPGGGRWARTPEADVRRLWPRGRSALGTVPAKVTRG
jgi:anaerobic selenocysteine-containing dehydrogenase